MNALTLLLSLFTRCLFLIMRYLCDYPWLPHVFAYMCFSSTLLVFRTTRLPKHNFSKEAEHSLHLNQWVNNYHGLISRTSYLISYSSTLAGDARHLKLEALGFVSISNPLRDCIPVCQEHKPSHDCMSSQNVHTPMLFGWLHHRSESSVMKCAVTHNFSCSSPRL